MTSVVQARLDWDNANKTYKKWERTASSRIYKHPAPGLREKLSAQTRIHSTALGRAKAIYRQRLQELETIPYSTILSADFDEAAVEAEVMAYVHDLRCWIKGIAGMETLFPAAAQPAKDADGDQEMSSLKDEDEDERVSQLPFEERIDRRLRRLFDDFENLETELETTIDYDDLDQQVRILVETVLDGQDSTERAQVQEASKSERSFEVITRDKEEACGELRRFADVYGRSSSDWTGLNGELEGMTKTRSEVYQAVPCSRSKLTALSLKLQARIFELEQEDAEETKVLERLTLRVINVQAARQERIDQATVQAYLPHLQELVRGIVEGHLSQVRQATDRSRLHSLEEGREKVLREVDENMLETIPALEDYVGELPISTTM